EVRRNNDAGWYYHAEDPYRKSFYARFEGCYAHAFGPTTDTLMLYRIQPQPNHNYQFVIDSHRSHYFELDTMYSVIPVDQSPILYGLDEEPFSLSALQKLEDESSETDYYSIDVTKQIYEGMQNHNTFKLVMHIQDRKGNNYIIYRVFPLVDSLIKEGEYQSPKSYNKSCPPLPAL
ncbi:MAG: hypothetical protein J6A01_09045, partial [Proteobacteria bacterium]|nr:hypothetical protein [Pseudomonadota bacterium]